MWQPEWEESLGKNGSMYMYMYDGVPLLFTWNYHNTYSAIPQYKIKSKKKKSKYKQQQQDGPMCHNEDLLQPNNK